MKTITILEGQFFRKDSIIPDSPQEKLYQVATELGFTVNVLENIYHQEKDLIIKTFLENECFYFSSTFLYSESIAKIASLLAKIPSKTFFICGTEENNNEGISSVLSKEAELCTQIDHHTFYSVLGVYEADCKIDIQEPIDLFDHAIKLEIVSNASNEFKAKISSQKAIENAKWSRAVNNPTGRKIKIGEIVAFNKAFSTLKEGDIVDELDPVILEDESQRGVWVWGDGEPVKLLNESNYFEFEFQNMISSCVFEELFKWSKGLDKSDNVILLFDKIGDKLQNSHQLATDLLDAFGLPRRNLREKLVKMIETSRNTYFKPRVLQSHTRRSISLGV